MFSDLSDAEIDDICSGLKQSAAKIRHPVGLGLTVDRKPNGRPLVNRAHYEAIRGSSRPTQGTTGSGPIWGVH